MSDEREDRLSEEAWAVAKDIIKRAGDQTLSSVEELIRDEILLHRREIERLQVDGKRLDYLIEHDAGLTRDSIDASMTWKGTGNDEA